MSHPPRRPLLLAASLCVAVLLAFGLLWGAASNAASRGPVADAWGRAQAASSYHFSGDLTQLTTPSAAASTVGQSSRTQTLHLEGANDQRAAALEMRLWSDGGSVLQTGDTTALRVEHGKTYVREGAGAWQQRDDVSLDGIAPQGDFLAYLGAIRDVTAHPAETRAGISFTRYSFTLDGPAFATYMRDQVEQALRAKNALPPGQHIDVSAYYRDMTGEGELWVGADGLPLRQVMELAFPEQHGERINAQLAVTFSQFGSPLVATPLDSLGALAAQLPSPWQLALGALALLGMAALVHYSRSRRLQKAFAATMIASMLLGPALTSAKTRTFLNAQSAQATSQQQQRKEADAERAVQSQLSAPHFDPQRDPLVTTQSSPLVSSPSSAAAQPQAPPPSDNGTDTDKDGLTDFQEERVGTDPTYADSDEDGIPDGVEVRGFQVGGKTWYANPNDADSNADGIGDTIERDANNDGAPDDTDGDGTPDLFDFDNDNDGVPDSKDLAPFSAAGTTAAFSEANPLSLTVRNLVVGKPSFVDFQVRPKNTKHLWFAFNVLDWPNDSAGQLRDIDGKSYADVGTASANGPAIASEPYGDTKLIPMLEIRVPNGGANLPPQRDLVPFGISVNNFVADGSTKLAYVPLNIVTDEKTGQRVAFNGHMRYAPTGNWAPQSVRLVWTVQALVDVPCDATNAADKAAGCASDNYYHNTPQVVQTYYDDWSLTGMNVTEDNGASVATAYEDPAADANLKDDAALVALAQGLDNSFLSGRDQDKNGQRDVDVAEIVRRFDRLGNAGVTETQRWAIPNTLRVERQDYSTFDQAMASTTMTETQRILNTQFAPRWRGDTTIKPLLLFAQEQRSRAIGLDGARAPGGYVSVSGSNLSVDLQPAGQARVPLNVLASVKWTPYCGSGGAPTWAPCAPDAYWDELGARYGAGTVEGDPADPEVNEGRLITTQLYFATLSTGLSRIVQSEQRVASPSYSLKTDTDLEKDVRFYTKLSTIPVKALASEYVKARYVNGLTFFKHIVREFKILRAGSTGQLAKDAADIFKAFRSGGHVNRLVGTAIIGGVAAIAGVIVTGVILGYFTSDPSTQLAGKIIIKTLTSGISLYFSVYKPLSTVKEWASIFNAAGQKLSAFSSIGASAIKSSIVGAVVVGVITWGLFIFTMVSGNVAAFSPEFNKALAETVAASLLLYLSVALGATVVGTVILAIAALIDIILTAICELGVDALRTVPGLGGACFSLNTAAVKVLSYLLYNYDLMIDTNRDDLMVPGVPQVALADPNKGYVAGNAISLTMPVTTTIRHKDPDPANGLYINGYLYLFSPENLRSTTFKYSITAPYTGSVLVVRDQMKSEWQNVVVDHRYVATPMYRGQASARPRVNNVQLPVGLNRPLEFYLNAGYALPAYECWPLPHPLVFFSVPPIPICYTREYVGTTASKFDSLKFDILPATLDGFMTLGNKDRGQGLAWDAAFGPLADADGDNLLGPARNGADPNDATPDADNDGLTDAYELDRRASGVAFSPTAADTDADGLSDLQEMRAGSNPAKADSDGDGLTDKQEVDGWDVTINGATPFVVRVSSDPRRADSDSDGISDKLERQFALDANAANRLDANLVPFNPLLPNTQAIQIYGSVDDRDGFVAPGGRFVYTTTVVTTIPLGTAQLAVQFFNSAVPPYTLNLATPGTYTQQTTFTIAAGSPTQTGAITSRVDTRRADNGAAISAAGGATMTIDNDKPSAVITSLRNGQYVQATANAARTLIVGGTASDPTSAVDGVTLAGQAATGTASWSAPFALREGPNTLQARATDVVGNLGDPSPALTVYGDAIPPTATWAKPSAALLPTRSASGQWVVRLSGSVQDTATSAPGSGVSWVEVLVSGRTEGNTWQRAAVSGNAWTLDYLFSKGIGDKTPTGLHDVQVRAADAVGNLSAPQSYPQGLDLDASGPLGTLTKTDASTGAFTSAITNTVTVAGVITDTGTAGLDKLEVSFAPLEQVEPLSDTLMQLNFDERQGAQFFADGSGQFNNAGCEGTCNLATLAGPVDQALELGPGRGTLAAPSAPSIEFPAATATSAARSFSVQAWVKISQLNGNTTGTVAVVDKLGGPTSTSGGYRLSISNRVPAWEIRLPGGGASYGAASFRTIKDEGWHHLVGVVDRKGNGLRLYMDGEYVGGANVPNAAAASLVGASALRIGNTVASSNLNPVYPIGVDQVAVIGHPLTTAEAGALYRAAGRKWYPATLARRGAGVGNSAWTLPIPADLEGQYQIDLRGSDVLGNLRRSSNVWRGLIDTRAPRVTFVGRRGVYTSTRNGVVYYEMNYGCVAEDSFLTEEQYGCGGFRSNFTDARDKPLQRTFNTDPTFKALFPDASVLIKLGRNYWVFQPNALPTGTAQACDIFKHCTTVNATYGDPPVLNAASADAGATLSAGADADAEDPTTSAAQRPSAVILSPTRESYVAADGPFEVVVAAEAAAGLKEVTLKLDGQTVATLPFTKQDASTSIQHTFELAISGAGAHTLEVFASDWAGKTQKRPFAERFTLDAAPPTLTISNTSETLGDSYTLGSGVLRLRGSASDDAGVSVVQVRVGDMPFVDAELAGAEWHIAYPLGDPEGQTLVVTVRAIDMAGHTTDVQRDIPVTISEASPPDTSITSAPASTTSEITATFTFTSTPGEHDASAFACQLDEGHFTPCTSPASYANLSKGGHTFRVRAIDTLGFVDPSPASATWTVSASTPDATITDKPANPSARRAVSFAFSGDASAASFECALDGGAWAACASPQPYSGLADGLHTFQVRAKDAAGKVGTADRYAWREVDAAPVALDRTVIVTGTADATIALAASDEDPLTYHVHTQPKHGMLLSLGATLVYTPDTGYVGGDSFTFSASDGELFSNIATLTLDVRAGAQSSYGLSSFVALAQEDVTIKANGQVLSGSVAANVAGGSVRVGEGVAFRSADSHVLADTIELKAGATVYNPGYNHISGAGTVLGTPATPLALPVVSAPPALPAITPGRRAVEVKEGESLTLDAGSYAALTVRERGTLILRGGVYHFASWRVDERAQVRFAAPSEVRIAGRMALSAGIYLGPADGSGTSARDIVIFVGGEAAKAASSTADEGGQPELASSGGRTTIAANIVAPNGTLRLYEHTDATGAFFAKRILIGADATLRLDSAFANGTDGRTIPQAPQPIATDGAAAEYEVYLPLIMN